MASATAQTLPSRIKEEDPGGQLSGAQDKRSTALVNNTDVTDKSRGRRRSRPSNSQTFIPQGTEGADKELLSSGGDGAEASTGPRKRRRSRRGLDKKFECPHEDCDKSYSRAEHLYRHQLNHTPKQIYACDYPNCDRTFVRQDLCNRHKERHTAKGSQLQRKDSMLSNISPLAANRNSNIGGALSPSTYIRPDVDYGRPNNHVPQTGPSYSHAGSPTHTDHADNSYWQGSSYPNVGFSRQLRNPGLGPLKPAQPPQRQLSMSSDGIKQEGFQHPANHSVGPSPTVHPVKHHQLPPFSEYDHRNDKATNPHNSTFIGTQHFAPFSLPPPGMSPVPMTSVDTGGSPATFNAFSSPQHAMAMDYQMQEHAFEQSGAEMMLLDEMTAGNTMAVFGNEGFESNRSPFAGRADDFSAWFFGQQQQHQAHFNSNNQTGEDGNVGFLQDAYQPSLGNDISNVNFPQNQQHPMAVTSILDPTMPEMVLSDERSQEIIDLIKERFNERDLSKQKEDFLDGDRSDHTHMMSTKMMQTYMDNFWWHFHPQLPILHKPTFSPEKSPKLLLIAIMSIGASCLDKVHGVSVTKSCAELAHFLASHLRWEIFSHAHAKPPAKLWVFQALILLEIYEKMFSTRGLHERAHIHHASTITLMRRGSSLTGRPADSPPSARDGRPGVNGSRQSSTSGVRTPDEWWSQWIITEATHRAAWAAFVIDSVHATMFGHSTTMIAHEMVRVPLPCDELLWSATNSAEVGRLEASMHAEGIKPLSFHESLKRTLEAQEVRTNAFGRTILMAGLLSVGWHMNQRDVTVTSLGGAGGLASRDQWRGSLTRSFDNWRKDFDRALARNKETAPGPYPWSKKQNEEIVFESRTVLHHLAHMAMHVDIVECQIFARAKRLLGRTIGPRDVKEVTRKMTDKWVSSAKARDATYFAIQFLCTVLLPESEHNSMLSYSQHPEDIRYTARDDVLMNRSWVLYFAALVVWSYAFALEGPCRSRPPLEDSQEQVRAMRVYLRKMRQVKTPDGLMRVTGFNECAGMLQVIQHTFKTTRWELLQEAANLLNNCIHLITGQIV